MAIIDDILKRQQEPEEKPQPQGQNWLTDVIGRRYQDQQKRKQYNPVGFQFQRDPFDISSYYREIGSFKDMSRAATMVVQQEVANRKRREAEAAANSLQGALSGAMADLAGNFQEGTGGSRNYKLGRVTGNVSRAASYFGGKYGIKNVGGYRDHGSVPGSDHPKGRALDFMTSNLKTGNNLAYDLIKNYKKWSITYVIWNRHIWSPSKGWRKYSGPSAHTDHVHASFSR